MDKEKLTLLLWVVLPLILSPALLSGQITFERWYGGTMIDWSRSVAQTSDGGYIIVGYTSSYGSGSPGDVYLIKTDSLGDTLWTKTYGSNQLDIGYSVAQTADDGYIIAGYTESFGSYPGDVYLIKTDSMGDTLWTKVYGDSLIDEGYSVVQTADDGYIIAGYTFSYDTGYDVYLIKTDSLGDSLWTKTYGGIWEEHGNSVSLTADCGYLIVGETFSLANYYDVYLIKIDSLGDTLWTKAYGTASSSENGYSVTQTTDNGYIIAGERGGTGSLDVYLIKTDSLGDSLWARIYGGSDDDHGRSVAQTADEGYIIAGWTGSFGAGSADLYLIKTDSLGDTLWTRTYGGISDEAGYSVKLTSDGGYVIAGETASFGSGYYDVYLIKTDSMGSTGVREIEKRVMIEQERLSCCPNPFTKTTMINVQCPVPSDKASLKIYDIAGRLVRSLQISTYPLISTVVPWHGKDNAGNYVQQGLYFVKLEIEVENMRRSYKEKIIKLSK